MTFGLGVQRAVHCAKGTSTKALHKYQQKLYSISKNSSFFY